MKIEERAQKVRPIIASLAVISARLSRPQKNELADIDRHRRFQQDVQTEMVTIGQSAKYQWGWCKDKSGLSWQITPRILPEATMSGDKAAARRAFERMMRRKKIDIAAVEAAMNNMGSAQ